MKIIAVVGYSESGKTRLIARLAPELAKRGLDVAVVKHCGHGFEFGGPQKDSSKFLLAGIRRVALSSPGKTAVIETRDVAGDLGGLARERFSDADLVLIEGGKFDPRLRKMEVLRQGISDRIQTPAAELEAVVADFPVCCAVPVLHPEDIGQIAGWLAEIYLRRDHVQSE